MAPKFQQTQVKTTTLVQVITRSTRVTSYEHSKNKMRSIVCCIGMYLYFDTTALSSFASLFSISILQQLHHLLALTNLDMNDTSSADVHHQLQLIWSISKEWPGGLLDPQHACDISYSFQGNLQHHQHRHIGCFCAVSVYV